MSKVGRRSQKVVKTKLELGAQVKCKFEGEWYTGAIQSINKSKAVVLFEDGDELEVKLTELKAITQKKADEPSDGFDQYNIEWNQYTAGFSIKTTDVLFYGHFIKGAHQGQFSYSIDIRAKLDDGDISVESLRYRDGDPRDNMASLNADICCAVSRWFYYHCDGEPLETIAELRKQASRPIVKIQSLESIDQLIETLKTTRQVAIKCGGVRYCTIESDVKPEESPVMTIQIDLSSVAKLYQKTGKVPQHISSRSVDTAISTGGKKKNLEDIKNHSNGSSSSSIDLTTLKDLLAQIEKVKDDGSLKKYRKMLRTMGIKGGVNGLKKAIEQQTK